MKTSVKQFEENVKFTYSRPETDYNDDIVIAGGNFDNTAFFAATAANDILARGIGIEILRESEPYIKSLLYQNNHRLLYLTNENEDRHFLISFTPDIDNRLISCARGEITVEEIIDDEQGGTYYIAEIFSTIDDSRFFLRETIFGLCVAESAKEVNHQPTNKYNFILVDPATGEFKLSPSSYVQEIKLQTNGGESFDVIIKGVANYENGVCFWVHDEDDFDYIVEIDALEQATGMPPKVIKITMDEHPLHIDIETFSRSYEKRNPVYYFSGTADLYENCLVIGEFHEQSPENSFLNIYTGAMNRDIHTSWSSYLCEYAGGGRFYNNDIGSKEFNLDEWGIEINGTVKNLFERESKIAFHTDKSYFLGLLMNDLDSRSMLDIDYDIPDPETYYIQGMEDTEAVLNPNVDDIEIEYTIDAHLHPLTFGSIILDELI